VYEIAEIRKYPHMPHLEGARLQPGDEDLNRIKLAVTEATAAGRGA